MNYKRLLSSMLLIITLICFGLVAYAEDDTGSAYASALINSYSVRLTNSGTTLSASASVTAKAKYDQVGFSTLKFQKYTDGSWVTVKTISAVYRYEAASYSGTHTYTGESGEKYRVVCTFYVRNGTTSDSRTSTSSSITL